MWDWVEYTRGHSPTQLQLDLLKQVQQLVPSGIQVSLVGDGEFKHPLLIEELDFFRLGWDWLERRLAFDDPIPINFRPDFSLVSGC